MQPAFKDAENVLPCDTYETVFEDVILDGGSYVAPINNQTGSHFIFSFNMKSSVVNKINQYEVNVLKSVNVSNK